MTIPINPFLGIKCDSVRFRLDAQNHLDEPCLVLVTT